MFRPLREEFNIKDFIHWAGLRSFYTGGWVVVKLSRLLLETPFHCLDALGDAFEWSAPKLQKFSRWCLRQIAHLFSMPEGSIRRTLKVVDAMPWGGASAAELEDSANEAAFEICTDILELLKGKHALVVGGTGDGKTTTVMYIAYMVGGTIKIYDADAEAMEWQGLTVIGRCADFKAIDHEMKADLDYLQELMTIRGSQGDAFVAHRGRVLIAEEFPLLVGEVPTASEWLIRHAKRGRRVRQFVIAVAQNDTAKNFGFEGDTGTADCFARIYLGKKAIARAKKLKNAQLVDWLRAERGRLLCDDVPVQLPPYSEIKRVIQGNSNGLWMAPTQVSSSSQSVIQALETSFDETPETDPETTENQALPPSEPDFSGTPKGGEIALLERILGALAEGRSDDWIAKNVVIPGERIGYYKAREKVEALRSLWQAQSAKNG